MNTIRYARGSYAHLAENAAQRARAAAETVASCADHLRSDSMRSVEANMVDAIESLVHAIDAMSECAFAANIGYGQFPYDLDHATGTMYRALLKQRVLAHARSEPSAVACEKESGNRMTPWHNSPEGERHPLAGPAESLARELGETFESLCPEGIVENGAPDGGPMLDFRVRIND